MNSKLLQIGDLIRLAPVDDYFSAKYAGAWRVLSVWPEKVVLRRCDSAGEPTEEAPRVVNIEIDLLDLWFKSEYAWPMFPGELMRGELMAGGKLLRWLLLDATVFGDTRAVWQTIPWRPGYTGPGLMFAEVPFIAACDERTILVKQVIGREAAPALRLAA